MLSKPITAMSSGTHALLAQGAQNTSRPSVSFRANTASKATPSSTMRCVAAAPPARFHLCLDVGRTRAGSSRCRPARGRAGSRSGVRLAELASSPSLQVRADQRDASSADAIRSSTAACDDDVLCMVTSSVGPPKIRSPRSTRGASTLRAPRRAGRSYWAEEDPIEEARPVRRDGSRSAFSLHRSYSRP